MCTWLVIETIDLFLRKGGEVFMAMMDMTKAFDLVRHSTLFRKLLDVGLSVIFVRLLLSMYILQFANVRWNGKFSESFFLSNGVKQGGVISAILYCVYMNGLFQMLRKRRAGCWVNNEYHGIIGYADDNFLLAPSINSLQEMLQTCEEYAENHNLKFSTHIDPQKSKTKCLAFLKKDRSLRKLTLCGDKLPWVNSGKHLGNTIENDLDGMSKDLMIKRAKYIERNLELNQEFHFAHPETKVNINNIYNSHFSGSPLWNLFTDEAVMLEKIWNVSIRKMFNLPREPHRFFIEE